MNKEKQLVTTHDAVTGETEVREMTAEEITEMAQYAVELPTNE